MYRLLYICTTNYTTTTLYIYTQCNDANAGLKKRDLEKICVFTLIMSIKQLKSVYFNENYIKNNSSGDF